MMDLETVVATAGHVCAALVLVAGVSKVRRPGETDRALALSHLPASRGIVRVLGLTEIVLAGAILGLGGRSGFVVLSVAYVCFLAVAARQRQLGRACGCFGTASGTVGPIHLIGDTVAAGVAAAAAVTQAPSVVGLLQSTAPVAAGTWLTLGVTAVMLAVLAFTTLPDLFVTVSSPAPGGRG